MSNRFLKCFVMIFMVIMIMSACNFPIQSINTVELPEKIEEVMGKWNYDVVFDEPIKAEVNDEEVMLGSLLDHGVSVRVYPEAIEGDFSVELRTPESVPEIPIDSIFPISSPIEIVSNKDEKRLDEPVSICFSHIYTEAEERYEDGEIFVYYYNGEDWDIIKPPLLFNDENECVVCFSTYHFSLFGWGKVSVEKRVEKYTHNAAMAGYVQGKIDDKLEETAESIVKHILTQNLGIKDESVKEQVLSSLLLDDQWGDLVEHIKDGDPSAIEDIGLLAGRAIVIAVPDSTMKSALKTLTGDTGVAVSKAAANATYELLQGNYEDAAKTIVEGIADQFVITTAAKIVVQGIEASIEYWKNAEVEAAYQAYKNGSRQYFYGYNVDARDFNSIWTQMRGLARQLELEAIKQQNDAREELGYPALTGVEEEKIRESVRVNLEKDFKNRIRDEEEIAKKEIEIKKLIELYDENKLLLSGVMGYRSEYEIENRLDTLLHLKDKIMRDLEADQLVDGILLHDGQLGMDAVVAATLVYMTDGKEAYNAYIEETFGIVPGDEEIEEEEDEEAEEIEEEEVVEVKAQKVTAVYDGPWHEFWDHDCSKDREKITLVVWNLGKSGGNETDAATMVWITHNTSKILRTEEEIDPCNAEDRVYTTNFTGWFSGGPDGSGELFQSDSDQVAYHFRFIDGSTVEVYNDVYPDAKYKLTVQNPDAFDGMD